MGYKKDGGLTATSSVLNTKDMEELSKFVTRKVKECGKSIVEGDISINPIDEGQSNSCAYCPYKGDCGFDSNERGYTYRKLQDFSEQEVMQKIREENAKWQ